MLNSFLSLQKDSEQDNGHSSDLNQRKNGVLSIKPIQNEWDNIAEKMMVTLAESRLPIFRVTSPLSRGVLESKSGGKLSIHCADHETIKTVFRTIASVNQLSLHGAVAEMWRIFMLSWQNGVTRRERTIEFLIRAKRDQDKRAFE